MPESFPKWYKRGEVNKDYPWDPPFILSWILGVRVSSGKRECITKSVKARLNFPFPSLIASKIGDSPTGVDAQVRFSNWHGAHETAVCRRGHGDREREEPESGNREVERQEIISRLAREQLQYKTDW